MKNKYILLVAAATLAGSGLTAVSPVAAAVKPAQETTQDNSNYLTTYPKKLRGTWYYYNGKKLCKEVIGKKTITDFSNGKKFSHLVLHADVAHDPATTDKAELARTKNWVTAEKRKFQNLSWVGIHGWSDAAGAGNFINVSQLKGHKVLTSAYGSGVWADYHAYKTPKLAKKLQKKHYHQFSYLQ
ncbi:hypothetical protein [Lactobacillus sp. ESL0677]|uniref:hypothetical protein n=1 Tax=Lactobacillus sp. ESL0677 TaxID=2983208 RepID=UPI0023F9AAD0|nr:hypothetical protein [Lactobacillus sp. ESL0677]WEV37358.1 hypothetical protein OZX76_01885 [Lactobacillus sp. ESL0677]